MWWCLCVFGFVVSGVCIGVVCFFMFGGVCGLGVRVCCVRVCVWCVCGLCVCGVV